jgi:hypothetical protein
MPNDIDPEVLQVIGCQGRQDRVVDFVLTKRPFVLPKAKAPEPVTYIDRAPTCHGLIVQAGTVVSRLAAMPLAIAVGRFTARSGLTQFSQENAPAASAESARAFGIKPHRPAVPAAADAAWYLRAMANPYGIKLDDQSLRWAAAEGVPESVIAAICLLAEKAWTRWSPGSRRSNLSR